jgi:hypothetical protein
MWGPKGVFNRAGKHFLSVEIEKSRNREDLLMSAIGPKQTLQGRRSMSAFGGKADIAVASQNVRF